MQNMHILVSSRYFLIISVVHRNKFALIISHTCFPDCGFYLLSILATPYTEKIIQFLQFQLFFVYCCSMCSGSFYEPFAQPALVAGREREPLQVSPEVVK